MDLKSKQPVVLVTAGPTKEAIDPVRFISNHSSGKMGYAISEAFLNKGYKVILVSGPVALKLAHPNLTVIHVSSALEMYSICKLYFSSLKIAVFTAAVADYRPKEIQLQKLKKKSDEFELCMVKNIDIAFEFGKVKRDDQFSIGFALETENEKENALRKLTNKNFDLIVLNSVRNEGATFGFDTNMVTLIDKDFNFRPYPLKSKKEVGEDIVEVAIQLTSIGSQADNFDQLN